MGRLRVQQTVAELGGLVEVVDEDCVQVDGSQFFFVFQQGVWWWKSWAIGYLLADTGAPASGDVWEELTKEGYSSLADARRDLQSGNFPKSA